MSLTKPQRVLFNLLQNHSVKIKNTLYYPGPYWDYKTKKITYWLKKNGLNNFRSIDSSVGTSYTDGFSVDVRRELGFKGRFLSLFFSLPLVNKIFKKQVDTARYLFLEKIFLQGEVLSKSEKIKSLLSKYKIENSVSFGCAKKISFKNIEYSTHYLSFLERIDNLSTFSDFKKINSLMEIGGGYGANIHLLIQNFKNLKKIFYVDIFPNIFVGTEYLKSHFGNAVKDYSVFCDSDEIRFNDDNELEIICIPNWALEKVKSKIDKFHNCASFQEMKIEQVKNYKRLIENILNKNSIDLIIYAGWEKNNTLSPEVINEIFDGNLIERKFIDTVENSAGNINSLTYLTSL